MIQRRNNFYRRDAAGQNLEGTGLYRWASSGHFSNYDEALGWVDTSIQAKETIGNLNIKAGLLAEMGRFDEAVVLGEKALTMAKALTPPNPGAVAGIEDSLKKWKAKRTS